MTNYKHIRPMFGLCFVFILLHFSEAAFTTKNKYASGYAIQLKSNQRQYLDSKPVSIGSDFSTEFLLRWRGNKQQTVMFYAGKNNKKTESFAVYVKPDGGNKAKIGVETCSTNGNCQTLWQDGNFAKEEWTYFVILANGGSSSTSVNIYFREGSKSLQYGGGRSLSFVPYGSKAVSQLGNGGNGDYLDGDLDEVRLWGVAFTIWDIIIAFLTGNEPRLIAYWSFNEGSGNIIRDSSPQQYHLSLYNGPVFVFSAPLKERSCSAWGSKIHLNTFDKNCFDQTNFGDFYLVRQNATGSPYPFEIQGRINSKPTKGRSLTGVALKYKNDVFVFDTDFFSKSDSNFYVNGVLQLQDDVNVNNVTVTKTYKKGSQEYNLVLDSVFQVTVVAEPKKQETTVTITVVESIFMDKLAGLCGNLNGNKNDDVSVGAEVASQNSLFNFLRPVDSPVVYDCDIEIYAGTELYNEAQQICSSSAVDPDLKNSCLFDVCVSQDIGSATEAALLTYLICVERVANNETTETCVLPCPNFCSFHGTCNGDGTCSCDNNYGGNDCSQQVTFPCFKANWNSGSMDLEPFVGSKDVAAHYAYEKPYTHSSNAGTEVSDSTVMYLYQDSRDRSKTNFVFINDLRADGSGGKMNGNFLAYNKATKASFPLTIAVRDDKDNDSFKTSGNAVVTQWKWASCCTDGIAFSNLPASFCLNVSLSNIDGINQIYLSSQNLFGEQDIRYLSLDDRAGLQVCGDTCTNPCGQHSSCSACTSDSRCGWCADSGTCEYGGAGGPQDGYCGNWRYTTNDTFSRVVLSNIAYPVSPSQISVFLAPNSNLQASFSLNFPPLNSIPQEILILHELTSNWILDLLLYTKGNLPNVFTAITKTFPNTRLALGSFTDKPMSPYGSNGGDYVYRTDLAMTNDLSSIKNTVSNWKIKDGKDSKNSQLEALFQAAVRDEVGWTDGTRKIIFVVSRTDFHDKENNRNLVDNNGDAVIDANENYPTRDQVRAALLQRNIVPVFIVSDQYSNNYQKLVNEWGFGQVIEFWRLWAYTAYDQLVNSVTDVAGSATPIIEVAGKVTKVDGRYTGIQPLTRVFFTASINANSPSNTPAVITLPGFGKVNINYIGSDTPVADNCPNVTVYSNSQVAFRLSGSSNIYRDALSVVFTSLPSSGTFYQYDNGVKGPAVVNTLTDSGNRVIYVPSPSANGPISFSYKLVDECESCSVVQTCSINVIFVAGPPVATFNGTVVTEVNTPSPPFNLSGISPTGAPVRAVIVRWPTVGGRIVDYVTNRTLTQSNPSPDNPNNEVYYVPPENQVGPKPSNELEDFSYVVKDTSTMRVQSNQVMVTTAVRDRTPTTNTGPTLFAINQSLTTNEDIRLDILMKSNDTELNTCTTTCPTSYFYITSLPQHGKLYDNYDSALIAVGHYVRLTGVGSRVYYIPDLDWNGSDSFNYLVNSTKYSSTATNRSSNGHINITVLPVNDAPVANNTLTFSGPANSLIRVELSGAIDVDNDPLVYSVCNWQGAGSLFFSNGTQVPTGVTSFVVPDRLLDYRNLQNGTETINFLATDPSGLSSTCGGIVKVTATYVNYAPVAATATPQTAAEARNASILLVGTDDNSFDHPLTFKICKLPDIGTLYSPSGAVLNVNSVVAASSSSAYSSQVYVTFYIPNNNNGFNVDYFTYSVNDGHVDSACFSVYLNVNSTNVAPIATGPSTTQVFNEDQAVTQIQLQGYDDDLQPITYVISNVPSASQGSLYDVVGGIAQTTPLTNGAQLSGSLVAFKPFANWNGATSFAFYVTDGELNSAPFTVGIQVTPVNDAPVAISGSVTTPEDTPIHIYLTATDIDSDINAITFTLTGIYTGVQACADPDCTSTTAGPFVTKYGVLYTPPADFNGQFSFTFTASDGIDASQAATITVTVTPVNDKPIASDLAFALIYPDTEYQVITLNATDVDTPINQLVVSVTGSFQGFLYQYDDAATNKQGASLVSGVVTDASFRVVYVPRSNPSGENPFTTITYFANDGYLNSDNGHVTINVTNADLPPVAHPATASGLEDTLLTIIFTATDADSPLLNVTATITALPKKGKLLLADGQAIAEGQVLVGDPLTVDYLPDADGFGDDYDYFLYYVTNGGKNSSETQLTISITNVNDPPVATYPYALPRGDEDTNITVWFLGTDPDNDTYVSIMYTNVINGTLYLIDENDVVSNTPMVTDQVITYPYKALYVPLPNGNGLLWDRYSYYVRDVHGAESIGLTVPIQVDSVNDPPMSLPKHHYGSNNMQYTYLYLSVTDIDDRFNLVNSSLNSNGRLFGTITSFPNGVLYYDRGDGIHEVNRITPEQPNFYSNYLYFGTYAWPELVYGDPYTNFTYVISDTEATTDPVTDIITLNLVNQYAYITTTTNSTMALEGGPAVNITINATDPDGPFSDLRMTVFNTVGLGTLRAPNGIVISTTQLGMTLLPSTPGLAWTLMYTPDPNNIEPVSFSYRVRDAFNINPAIVTHTIYFTPVNDAPVAGVQNGTPTTITATVDSNNNAVSNATATNFVVSDIDAGTGILSVKITCDAFMFCKKLALVSTQDTQNLVINPANLAITFDGTLSTINSVLSQGVIYVPNKPGTGALNLVVNDNGHTGNGGPLNSNTFKITVSVQTVSQANNIASSSGTAATVTGAAAGGAALLSGGLYGVYMFLKRRKMLPEDREPWETDADFDNTLDNPLYSGTPSVMTSVTMVTSDN